MTVPTPASFTYFWQNTTIIAKYALSGVIEFIGESPTRYAASVASGGTPSFISSGTKLGSKIHHFGLPAVNGRQVADVLVGDRPGLRVLYASGHSEARVIPHGLAPGTAFLQKPFSVSALLQHVRDLLGEGLVRRLCEDCREAYRPDADMLKKNNLPPEQVKQFFRPPEGPNNCPTCGGLGYRGRVGVYELLVINDRLRDLIRENPQLSVIKAEARKNGMLYLKEEGLRLVVKGITSMDELMRVVK